MIVLCGGGGDDEEQLWLQIGGGCGVCEDGVDPFF